MIAGDVKLTGEISRTIGQSKTVPIFRIFGGPADGAIICLKAPPNFRARGASTNCPENGRFRFSEERCQM
jgi:hypothetical protein